MGVEKVTRGNAGQFFVAGELCRRGYAAVVTLGNTPNTDVLCSNLEGTKFVHIQVKTFVPGNQTCTVGVKAEKNYGENFFWVLTGIPKPGDSSGFEYYIIPSSVMAKNVLEGHQAWLSIKGKHGQEHKDNQIRIVVLPPGKSNTGWDVNEYRERWDLLEEKLRE
jgi:hypothetical protein